MLELDTIETVMKDNMDKIEVSELLASGDLKFERGKVMSSNGLISNYWSEMFEKGVKTAREYPLLSSVITVLYHTMHPIKSVRITRFWVRYVDEHYSRLRSDMRYPKSI